MKELMSSLKNLPKHFLTAIQNIWRNGVMSYSSVFAVTTTLLLLAVVGSVALNIGQMTQNISNGVRVYVKLVREITPEEEQDIGEKIAQIANVKDIVYSSKDEQLTKMTETLGVDGEALIESYRDDNPLGSSYDVEVTAPEHIEKVTQEIKKIPNVKEAQYGGQATENMLRTLEMIRTGGLIFCIGLVVIALFIISNTIKVTITTRSTEISIMRMVGASNWYIRIPFMLEGMLIGIIGSIIPILVLIYGYSGIYNMTGGVLGTMILSLSSPYPFIRDFSIILVVVGAGVGFIGSLFSVRKFLKI